MASVYVHASLSECLFLNAHKRVYYMCLSVWFNIQLLSYSSYFCSTSQETGGVAIVTEFMPRGSLFGLLRSGPDSPAVTLGWVPVHPLQRLRMAIDIAEGSLYSTLLYLSPQWLPTPVLPHSTSLLGGFTVSKQIYSGLQSVYFPLPRSTFL